MNLKIAVFFLAPILSQSVLGQPVLGQQCPDFKSISSSENVFFDESCSEAYVSPHRDRRFNLKGVRKEIGECNFYSLMKDREKKIETDIEGLLRQVRDNPDPGISLAIAEKTEALKSLKEISAKLADRNGLEIEFIIDNQPPFEVIDNLGIENPDFQILPLYPLHSLAHFDQNRISFDLSLPTSFHTYSGATLGTAHYKLSEVCPRVKNGELSDDDAKRIFSEIINVNHVFGFYSPISYRARFRAKRLIRDLRTNFTSSLGFWSMSEFIGFYSDSYFEFEVLERHPARSDKFYLEIMKQVRLDFLSQFAQESQLNILDSPGGIQPPAPHPKDLDSIHQLEQAMTQAFCDKSDDSSCIRAKTTSFLLKRLLQFNGRSYILNSTQRYDSEHVVSIGEEIEVKTGTIYY
ncbi:hypothetical protein [Pseudobacteriovorax antillogorgiicola]|uniref:Uncharacterized protein n=1 Tax=Pseudobacteriovorax antillogorgiicola TaxID=1513793 RepID=A0A1Y6C1Z8_9BACT|nr:hypothetical protein [Pseudobacteriovorax antillogorgiicola]TCS50661.1 hypothetical protein EDD56_11243 [Pseudobacteriovorax antillogorgiicola]SMF39889.1 hypothetical protein SAMN06296036_11242 [Pseudobacteriovorax antillogorgiicola]